jgi:hypothetical protein
MRLTTRRAAIPVLCGVAFLLVPLAAPAAAAPVSGDNPGPAASTTAFNGLDLFYETTDGTLVHQPATPAGYGTAENLGGALRTGPGAITIGSEFAQTWAFVTGTDNAVWYRAFSDGSGLWGPWATIGGASQSAPAASCTGDFTASPTVYVKGADGSAWRRGLAGGGWVFLGGRLGSAPAAVPAVGGVCPAAQDIVALGTNGAVYENRGGTTWTLIGGRSNFAPTITRLPNGRTELYVVGTDGKLRAAGRNPGSTVWSGFSLIGGLLTSSPAAQLWQSGPQIRVVVARGGNGRLYRGTNPIGSTLWTWAPVP